MYEQPKQKIVRGRIEEEDLLEHFHSHRFLPKIHFFQPQQKQEVEKNGGKLMGYGRGLQEYTFYKGLTSDIGVSLEDSHMKRYYFNFILVTIN